jgi:hypothetical protein
MVMVGVMQKILCCYLIIWTGCTSAAIAETYSGIPGGCCFFHSEEGPKANILSSVAKKRTTPVFSKLDGQMQYVDVNTLVVIYTHFYKDESVRMDLSPADIETLENEVAKSKHFIWRSSNLKCLMKTDYLIVDRTLTLDDLWEIWDGAYWLHYRYWGAGATTVEQDLYDAGIVDYQYSVILVLYAFKNSEGAGAAYSGAAYGVNTTMGDAAYIAIPLAWGLNCEGAITHEYLHALDSIFEASDNPGGNDMNNADHPESFPYVKDSGRHFNFLICNILETGSWLQLYTEWANIATATDSDNDGVPDSGELPITEETLSSNPAKQDTDEDGLNDLDELIATYYSQSNVLVQDSDGDGLLDANDPYPLYVYNDHIAQGQPCIDGAIEMGEYTKIVHFNDGNSDISAIIYARWLDDVLYVAADITDDILSVYYSELWWCDNLEVKIDAQQDGWLLNGNQNYRFYVVPRGSDAIADVVGHNFYHDPGNDPWHQIDVSAITAKYALRTGGYVIEMAIPASIAPGVGIYEHSSLRLTFQVEDYDTYPGWPRFNVFTGLEEDTPGFVQLYLVQNNYYADLNRDGIINFEDFTILAAQWLQDTGTPSADIAPHGGDGIIDFDDLAELIKYWLESIDS